MDRVRLLVLILGLVLPACGESTICEWPGRLNCEPVGTTVVVEEPSGDGCTQFRYFDEQGESAYGELTCGSP